MQHLCSVNPRLRFKFVGLTVDLTASVADNQWAASPRLSESSIWRGKRSGRDIRAHHLSASDASLQIQLPRRPASKHLQASVPEPSRDVRVPRSEAEQPGIMWLIVLASFLHCVSSYQVDLKKLEGLAKARVEVTQCFLWKRSLLMFTARLRSWTRVCFLPSIIVWINGFKCLCMTGAWIPLHMHSHFSHLDTKMKTT